MEIFTKLIANAVAGLALLASTSTFAQSSDDSHATRFGIGLNLGLATSSPYEFVNGGDIRLQKDFTSNVSGILSIGYTNFSVEGSAPAVVEPYDVVPVKVGVKVFPIERLYFSGEVGAGLGLDDGSKTAFIYAPGIGIGVNNRLDLCFRYEGFARIGDRISQVSLRIAYGFNLSR